MSAVTAARYRECSLNAFRRVLGDWLAILPPTGWEGTVPDLESALREITRRESAPTYISRGTGLGRRIAAQVPFIEASGFRVTFRRTKWKRTLRFTRSEGNRP